MARVRLFLGGDVMTVRGVDQMLPDPVDPALFEPWVTDARAYLELAEDASGPIDRPVPFDAVWGDALAELASARPDARVVNLETSVTRRGRPWADKDVHYRMSPGNAPCLSALALDACALANNHVLDWGYDGLEDTLAILDEAGVGRAGAGRDLEEATAPRAIELAGGGRVLVFSLAHPSSGVPPSWAAGPRRPGVTLVEDLSLAEARRLAHRFDSFAGKDDLVVVSIHWGPNWGFDVPAEQARFARALVAGGVHLVHGHSSHHIKGIEVFRGQPILYGCGDLIDDYEGIAGYEQYRADLGLLYLADLDRESGQLHALRMIPTRIRRLRIERATGSDAAWLRRVLAEQGARFGTSAAPAPGDRIDLAWRR